MTSWHLEYSPEPELRFAFDQTVEDPRDGLTLFGPLDVARPYGVRAGVVGTERGLELYRKWVSWAQRAVYGERSGASRPVFPGFSAAFRTEWAPDPYCTLTVTDREIDERLETTDPHHRVYDVVSLYADRIINARREEEFRPDLWFVVTPDRVKLHCRPKAQAPPGSIASRNRPFRSAKQARQFQRNPSLFAELDAEAEIYLHDVDFHNQLKARLLRDQIVTQGVRERTLANIVSSSNDEFSDGDVAMQSDIAWRLTTAVFYKCGGRPWKLASVRPGVCYVGLVFKQDHTHVDPRWACCAAQMFLDSGDGLVFKGALGPWHSPETEQFHLNYEAARNLIDVVLKGYRDKAGAPPKEVFVHGRTTFNGEEIRAFRDAAGEDVAVVGVTIKKDNTLKLFRAIGSKPVLRGLYHVVDHDIAHVWTKGYVPRLQTYPGWEVPNCLKVQTRAGAGGIDTIVKDILMLTKLNYNACGFADGVPVTLKFADAVGEILTAAPFKSEPPPPLPFRHYI